VSAVDAVRSAAAPLEGGSDEYDALLDLIGNARLVLIGEASHGTERLSHYFTARLSEQFDAVIHLDRITAVEPLDSSPG
jgi:erythromycin esterase-like protein